MNQTIAHPNDVGPGNARVRLLHLAWNSSGRLAEDFEQANDGEAKNTVGFQIRPALARQKAIASCAWSRI